MFVKFEIRPSLNPIISYRQKVCNLLSDVSNPKDFELTTMCLNSISSQNQTLGVDLNVKDTSNRA